MQGATLSIAHVDELFHKANREIDRLFPKRNISSILFVIPPDADASMFNFSTGKRGRYWNYPPYGAGVIAAKLQEIGIKVDIINLNHEILKQCHQTENESDFDFDKVWTSALHEKMKEFKPSFIGLSCMFTQTHQSTVKVVNELKAKYPDLPMSLGGVHPTNCLQNVTTSEKMLSDLRHVDLIFTYEAELAFCKFVEIVNGKLDVSELAQIYFNSSEEKHHFKNKCIPELQHELDVVPTHNLMTPTELSKYGTIGSFFCHKPVDTRFTTVLANRGCRAACTFCSVRNFNGVGVRGRSVQSVIDELLVLQNDYGVGHIMWLDDDFLYNPTRSLELMNEMVRQNIKMTWDCTNGVLAASCTDELMAAAVRSGCIGFNIGMESGNAKILRDVKKPANVDTLLRAAEVLKKYPQINARVFLMIGFPGETYRAILDTINVATKMNLDWYNVTILQPLPNTPIFESMKAQGLINDISFEEIRYNTGAYGKHRKIAETFKIDLLSKDFKDALSNVDLDTIPPKETLDSIWAYMNYHLNFRRLYFEDRPMKMVQQLNYVQNICDLVAPENAFAMYFAAYLQKKVHGKIAPEMITRLDERLSTSEYWSSRFKDFNLSLDHLKTEVFPEPKN